MSKAPKLGQVFLHDHNIIRKLLSEVNLRSTDKVIEVGCGDGILTAALEEKVSSLTVIEIDSRCIVNTKKVLKKPELIQWIHEDVLKVDFSQFEVGTRIVANIPYYLSSKFIQKCAYYKDRFEDITIMVQKEFAEKSVSSVGQKSYTSLAVFTQFHFDVSLCFSVSRHCFYPVPAIDSAVISLKPSYRYAEIEGPLFELLVKSVFWGKRKKLLTVLKKNPFLDIERDFDECSLVQANKDKRADHLRLEDYIALYKELFVY